MKETEVSIQVSELKYQLKFRKEKWFIQKIQICQVEALKVFEGELYICMFWALIDTVSSHYIAVLDRSLIFGPTLQWKQKKTIIYHRLCKVTLS